MIPNYQWYILHLYVTRASHGVLNKGTVLPTTVKIVTNRSHISALNGEYGRSVALTSDILLFVPSQTCVLQVVKHSLNSEVIGLSCVFVPFQFELEFNLRGAP